MKVKELFFKVTLPLVYKLNFEFLLYKSKISIFIAVYHSISDEVPLHLRYVYQPISKDVFISDLNFFIKHFKNTTIDFLLKSQQTKEYKKERFFILTFDDGLKEIYTTVYPILKEKNLNAIIFVNNAFIDNKDLFYRYKISLLINEIVENSKLRKKVKEILYANNLKSKKIINTLLKLNHNHLSIIDTAIKECEIDIKSYLNFYKPYLTSDQIKELVANGFYIGSHSYYHFNYNELSFEDRINDLKTSIQDIKTRFNQKYKLFAYPFTDYGLSVEWFNTIENLPDVDLTFGCAGLKNKVYSKHYQRIPMDKYKNINGETLIKLELLYFLTKKFFKL